jgi:hypothetical protein
MPGGENASASSAVEVASREPSRGEAGSGVRGARMRSGFVVEPLEAAVGVILEVGRMVHEESFLEAAGASCQGCRRSSLWSEAASSASLTSIDLHVTRVQDIEGASVLEQHYLGSTKEP